MSEAVQVTVCGQHPERMSTGICSHCSRPLCESCVLEVVATEQVFCSQQCRAASLAGTPDVRARSNDELRQGLKQPIRTGWTLWARSLRVQLVQLLPYSLAAALFFLVGSATEGRVPPGTVFHTTLSVLFPLTFIFGGLFGVALVGVIISRSHAGEVEGSPYVWTLRRFVPWLATGALTFVIVVAGYIALILPGIYLSMRLFWADEFALIHGKGPIAALRESWRLTRGIAGDIFSFQFVMGWAGYLVIIPALGLFGLLASGLEAAGLTDPDNLSALEGFALVLIAYVAYAALHAPEIVKFYGLRAARSSLDPAELARKDWLQREKNRAL